MSDPLQQNNQEIGNDLVGHSQPVQSLFKRYLIKNEQEREVFVLALIGRVVMEHKRKGASPCKTDS